MTDAAYDVFISYARSDAVRARLVRDRLAALGLNVFFDAEGIDSGEEFPVIIDRAVRGAKCVLGLWSRNAFVGRWVRIESRIGLDQDKLVAATIDTMRPEDLPAEFYNVNVVSLSDFNGQDNHEGWARIVRAIGKHVRREDLAGAPLPAPAPTQPFQLERKHMLIGAGVAAAAVVLIAANALQLGPAPVAANPARTVAGAAANMSGEWRGAYTEAGRETAFELRLEQNGDGFTGTAADADIYGIGEARGTDFSGEISGEVFADGRVRFTKTYRGGAGMSLRAVVYEGRLSADGRSVAGSWDTGALHGPFHMQRQ